MAKLKIIKGDITKQYTDAIVNAANNRLAGGGGVDGAIHRSAGMRQLNQACAKLGGCRTGQAKVTSGFNLPAKYIIHTVGPVYYINKTNRAQLLRSCYISSLDQAKRLHCRSVAFCSISTGVYGYPLDQASKIAVNAIESYNSPMDVEMVCFDSRTYKAYKHALNQYLSHNN